MKMQSLAWLALVLVLPACQRKVVVEHRHEQPEATAQPDQPAPQAAPAPPVEEAAPPYVEEGATVDGAVVTEPAGPLDYVETGGGWYYYHPQLHVWVHANRAANWHPPAGGQVYHSWAQHPMYRRR